jgi:hypothetical protein
MLLLGGNLIEPALVPSTLEGGLQPQRENLVGEPEGDDAPAHRQDVRVVVLARQARRVEIVAQRRAHTGDLVGGDLFALAAPADDDAAIGAAFGDRPPDGDADRRIVDGRLAVRAMIVDRVAEPLECPAEVLFQQEPGVVGADGDSHGR